MMLRAAVLALLLTAPGVAVAQSNETLKKAGDIASQPARDVGASNKEIPTVLQNAVEAPYAMPKNRTCKGLNTAILELNEVLGPDFAMGKEANENKTGKIAEAVGKTIVNSIIPFRGLVREISGAAPAERRLEAAIATGIARRGYLRGLATAKACKLTG